MSCVSLSSLLCTRTHDIEPIHSSSEQIIVTVGGDDNNTVSMFNWKREERLFKGSGGVSPVFLIRPTYIISLPLPPWSSDLKHTYHISHLGPDIQQPFYSSVLPAGAGFAMVLKPVANI